MNPIWQNYYAQGQNLIKVFEYQQSDGKSTLIDAAKKIKEASTLILSGMGSSHFACYPLHYQLAAMRKTIGSG
jgi:fructoselysine-6-P-deglycase FrlB-like protein